MQLPKSISQREATSSLNVRSFARDLRLAKNLAIQDLAKRYARSAFGPLWFILMPLMLLGIYYFVFGVAVGLSWTHPRTGQDVGFIVPFFAGLMLHLFLADVVTSSLSLFKGKRRLVKEAPVPLWVIWLGNMIRASGHALVNFVILLILTALSGLITVQGLAYAPVVLIWVGLFTGSISMILALIGPFFDDLNEAARAILRVIFYSAPISYPLSLVPESLQGYLWINPLTPMVQLIRETVLFGQAPALSLFSLFSVVVLLVCGLAWLFYRRVKTAVADVV